MPRFRTFLAVLVALTLTFAPVAVYAMAKSCQGMQHTMTDNGKAGAATTDNGGKADCPCHNSMPDCGSMPQCQTASGCASQCFTFCGTVPTVSSLLAPAHEGIKTRDGLTPSSLSIRPPSPPPRA